jgi:hypothetical protein
MEFPKISGTIPKEDELARGGPKCFFPHSMLKRYWREGKVARTAMKAKRELTHITASVARWYLRSLVVKAARRCNSDRARLNRSREI